MTTQSLMNIKKNIRFETDLNGRKTAVLLKIKWDDMEDFMDTLDALEKDHERSVPFEEAKKRLLLKK